MHLQFPSLLINNENEMDPKIVPNALNTLLLTVADNLIYIKQIGNMHFNC
jgi:hypothetical protein